MRRLLILACFCLLGSFVLGLNGCFPRDGSGDVQEAKPLPELSCIAVLPTAVPVASGETLLKDDYKMLLEGAAYLDSVLADLLAGNAQFNLLNDNQIDGILTDSWGGRIQQLRAIGQATGCGGVLGTTLSRYRQRVGSELSAETPAAVSFSMNLVGVEKGVVLWSTSFDEAQEALFDNIFTYKKSKSRGFKWITVQDLTQRGVQSRLDELPYYQKQE